MTLQRTTLSEKILSQKVFKCVFPLYSVLDSSGEQIRDCQELRRGSEKAVAPTPALLPGKSHGRRSLVGCSPWGR